MHSLRSARLLARLVLAWFVLAMGVAVASPMVQPQGLDLVCVGGGLKALPDGGDEDAPLPMGMDCPLCSTVGAPPPAAAGAVLPLPLHAVPTRAHRPAPAAAPLPVPPARGPPAHLAA